MGSAIEVKEPMGYGRCRMALLTDAWQGYHGIEVLYYEHDRRSQRAARAAGENPAALLPGVHQRRIINEAMADEYSSG